jgi:hypothetical protein
MIIIDNIEQGTTQWFFTKAGVVSASRASEYSSEPKLAPLPDDHLYYKDGNEHFIKIGDRQFSGANKSNVTKEARESLLPVYGDMRQGYMCELVAQICTGEIPEEMSFKQCEWGKDHEDEARAHIELELGVDVTVPAFIYRDNDKRFGVSPDGLIDGKKIGLELKVPFTSKVFVEFATCDKIKKEYIEQCQFSMWVTGYEGWYFANYDPRMKSKNLHYTLIERDQKYMDKYDRAEINFIKDMNTMLDKMGVEFGMQWQ